MRIATCQYRGRRHVGLVSSDGQSITPFAPAADEAQQGALALIKAGGDPGQAALQRSALAISPVRQEAPLPAPAPHSLLRGPQLPRSRQGVVGLGFQGPQRQPGVLSIVLAKVPECAVGPHDDVVLAEVPEQIAYASELAVVIGTGGRDMSRADDAPGVRLRQDQRRDRRPAWA